MKTIFLASRPKFLVASICPVLVGSILGYAAGGQFNISFFILALFGMMFLNAGANLANDYFDHLSRNDWVNENITPFSGGSRYIQKDILSPRTVLLAALSAFIAGAINGIVIILMTRSIFILSLGFIGLLSGYFYTAGPVKLGYRCVGEIAIGLLFGVLPVYGCYYLQAKVIDLIPLLPGCIVGILIFLVILINEFPDRHADAEVSKKTLVVIFGVPVAAWIYRITLIGSYVIAAGMMLRVGILWWAGLIYLFTMPLAVIAVIFANSEDLNKPGRYRANQITILLHTIGCLALTAGFFIAAYTK